MQRGSSCAVQIDRLKYQNNAIQLFEKKLNFDSFESRPANVHFLLNSAPPLQCIPVECCTCCEYCASFGMRIMEARAIMQTAGPRLEEIGGYFCDNHAGGLHRTCSAVLPFCCEEFCETAVEQCEQRCVGQFDLNANGKQPA